MPALLSCMILTACETTPTTAVISDACGALKTIDFDGELDTPETIAQVREHNARLAALCEKRGR